MLKRWLRGMAALGTAALVVACGGGGGGGSDPAPSANQPPRALALASGDARALANGAVGATVGGVVRLDASSSTDPESDTLSYSWTLLAKPSASTLVMAPATSAAIELRPDVLGDFTLSLKVTDSKGATSTQQVMVTADNRAPAPGLVVTPQFTPTPTVAPEQAVTVGASVVLDAAGSTDPDGDTLSVTFTLTEKPAGSTAALTVQGKTARFTADLSGSYRVRAIGSDGRGASFQNDLSFAAANRAPNPVLLAQADPVVLNAGEQTLSASVGYDVVLNGAASSDPDQQPLGYLWAMTSRPVGSAAALTSTATSGSGFSPDVLGEYVVTLTVSDPAGARGVRTLRVLVNNRRPSAQIGSNATPQAQAAAPRIRVPAGTELTLRGSLSSDADGDTLSYLWTVDTRPAGSASTLSATSVADPKFTPDVDGSYVLRLRVSDPGGAYSERTVTIEAGGRAPVAVVNRDRMTLLLGSIARASASLSFDEDGDTLSYAWTLDARPAGSTATLGTTNTAELQFTPDVVGTYIAAVTVRDATRASIAYVTVRVMPMAAYVSNLTFAPDDARYSIGLDRLVVVSTNPNSVRIIDPFTGAVRSVVLPTGVKNFSLSPDGKHALVLHEGSISLVDLEAGTVVRSTATGGSRTDGWVTNAGIAYLVGQTGGQWVDNSVLVFNARTGEPIPQSGSGGFGFFYGTQYGVLADRINKGFVIAQGLSPSDISYFTFNPATSQVTTVGDSPYHGDYPMYTPLFLSENQDLLFTAAGTYFRTDTLRHAGQLVNAAPIGSLSHSTGQDEALVLTTSYSGYGYGSVLYPSVYKRYTGSLLVPDTDLALPTINGAQSYGIKIFHSASGRHVILAQTGTNEARGAGVAYVVIVR